MAPGITVATKGINLEIAADGVPRKFLDDVAFLARPGEMTAIMGPSGCGKTTMLNVLSDRQSRKMSVTGDVYYAGRKDVLNYVNGFSAYVMQEDYMLQRLTVRETIVFAARLRLSDLPRQEQIHKADQVIKLLGLEACKDVLVGGSELKGISGGQRKRVSIAIALLDDPKILYLDEPTSGLDAALAYDVVATLEVLAKKHGKTVVATIHQPRAEVYDMFDNLLLMRSGRIVYAGPCAQALDYFASIGHPCPPDVNPSDFYLDLLTESKHNSPEDELVATGGDNSDNAIEMPQRIHVSAEDADKLPDLYAQSALCKKQLAAIDEIIANPPTNELTETDLRARAVKSGVVKTVVDFSKSVVILWQRALREGSRRPEFLYVNFIQVAFIGIVVSSLYWRIKEPVVPSDDCQISVARNAMGGMMQVVANTAFSSFDSATLQVNRRPLVNREASGGLYTRVAATIANWMADGVFHYLAATLFALIFYWTMGLKNQASSYFIWLLFIWSTKFAFWGSSTAIGSISPNLPAAMGLIPLTNVLLFQVTGFQMTDSEIPIGLAWLKNISPIRYAWQGIVRSQIDPLRTGYLEDCFGFRTPSRWIDDWGLLMAFALTLRALALVGSHFCHRNQGVQA